MTRWSAPLRTDDLARLRVGASTRGQRSLASALTNRSRLEPVVVFASDPTTAWEWLGFAAIMLTLAGLVGYLVRQAARRHRAGRDSAKATAASLPAEYRFRAESLRFRLMGGAVFVCATVSARVIGGPTAMVITAGIIAFPLYAVALRHRSQHEIIQSVRRAAADMDDNELRNLVEALEFHHGDVEMRPLRRLLVTRLQDHPT